MSDSKTDDKHYQDSHSPWRAHFGEKMMRTYISNGERTIYTSKDDADFLVEALNRAAKVESIAIPPARFYGGTIQDEITRAQIHGPNALTLEALETTLARAEAAERDFIQVHKNCIEARTRAEKAEQTLSARGENHALQAKIEEFRALKADWDSYGAEAFDPRTIDLAKEIANHLGPSWKCVPCADGPSIWLYRGDEEEILEVRTSYVGEKK